MKIATMLFVTFLLLFAQCKVLSTFKKTVETKQSNVNVKFQSINGDYLNRRDSGSSIYSGPSVLNSEWRIIYLSKGNIALQSTKGDYLMRTANGVSVGHDNKLFNWQLTANDGKICGQTVQLKSNQGDYLYRDSDSTITTREGGYAINWKVIC